MTAFRRNPKCSNTRVVGFKCTFEGYWHLFRRRVYSAIRISFYRDGSEQVWHSENVKMFYFDSKVNFLVAHLLTLTITWRQATVLILVTLRSSLASCDDTKHQKRKKWQLARCFPHLCSAVVLSVVDSVTVVIRSSRSKRCPDEDTPQKLPLLIPCRDVRVQ